MCPPINSGKRIIQSVNSDSGGTEIKYRGVRKRKWGKWVSEVRLPNSRDRIWLGSYDSSEKAARAFDAATFCLRGRRARLNFPDNPPQILLGRSMTHQQIQTASARHAHSVPTTKLAAATTTTKVNSPAISTSEISKEVIMAAATTMTVNSPTMSTSEISDEVMAAAMTKTMTSPSVPTSEIMSEEVMDWSFLNLLTKGFPEIDDFCFDFANPVGATDTEESESGFMMNSNLWNF